MGGRGRWKSGGKEKPNMVCKPHLVLFTAWDSVLFSIRGRQFGDNLLKAISHY